VASGTRGNRASPAPPIRHHSPRPPRPRKQDIRRHKGIRVTTPARTALDIAPRLTAAGLARGVNEARLNAGLRVAHLADVVERNPLHPGTQLLRTFIQHSTGPTRSEFEDRFLAFAREFGLPTPIVNARVEGYEVDALFLEARVVVELDGWSFHSSRRSFERDRERDTVLLAAGYVTVRITWERLTTQPEREAARLKTILESRAGHRLP